MTREEAIRIIKIVLAVAEDFEITVKGEEFTEEKCKEAVEMAIKALEQEPCEEELDFVQEHKKISCNLIVEPCEDAISRSDMLDAIGHGTVYTSEELQNIIKALPPVNPLQEPKAGHWILTSDEDYEYCTCSECGYQNGENWMIGSHIKFCQECGAKMIEPQERSE